MCQHLDSPCKTWLILTDWIILSTCLPTAYFTWDLWMLPWNSDFLNCWPASIDRSMLLFLPLDLLSPVVCQGFCPTEKVIYCCLWIHVYTFLIFLLVLQHHLLPHKPTNWQDGSCQLSNMNMPIRNVVSRKINAGYVCGPVNYFWPEPESGFHFLFPME